MKKILISEWVPEECLKPYEGEFEFTVPSAEKHAFTYEEAYNMVEDYDGYFILDNDGDQKIIDKAKNLLRFSEYSIGEITYYLGFSNESHFIQTFQKRVGETPNRYRRRCFRTEWELKQN